MNEIPSGLPPVDAKAFERALMLAGFLTERGSRDYGPAALCIIRRLEATWGRRLHQRDRRLHELRNRAVHHWLSRDSFDELATRAAVVLAKEE